MILQSVGPYLVAEPDAAPLLAEVDQHSLLGGGDPLEGVLELLPAVTAERAEHFAGQALGVDAGQDRLAAGDLAADQRQRLVLTDVVDDDAEGPPRRGQVSFRIPVRLRGQSGLVLYDGGSVACQRERGSR